VDKFIKKKEKRTSSLVRLVAYVCCFWFFMRYCLDCCLNGRLLKCIISPETQKKEKENEMDQHSKEMKIQRTKEKTKV